jgi:hypothetical protein
MHLLLVFTVTSIVILCFDLFLHDVFVCPAVAKIPFIYKWFFSVVLVFLTEGGKKGGERGPGVGRKFGKIGTFRYW